MLLAVHYRVMEHFGSLESSQEARVALGYRVGQLLRFFRALQTSSMLHNSMVHAKAWTNCLNLLPCEKQKCKLPFVTKNSKHFVATSGDDSSALIEFTPLWKTRVSNYPL